MNTEPNITNSTESTNHLLVYEKPEIITFGTVAKLTQGSGSHGFDMDATGYRHGGGWGGGGHHHHHGGY